MGLLLTLSSLAVCCLSIIAGSSALAQSQPPAANKPAATAPEGHKRKNYTDTSRQLPDLIVESGQTISLAARLHQYNSIHVKKGGTLIIRPNSSQWSIWWVTGDVTIEGSVIGKRFSRSTAPIKDRTPDGKLIEHKFAQIARGGTGGTGGTAMRGATRNGGTGAAGNNEYGGGGGSGGGIHIQGSGTRLGGHGKNATDWRGAPIPDGGYGNQGGDGGRLSTHSNGALLLIYSGGVFRGTGEVDLRGDAGEDGRQGGRGWSSNLGRRGAGGGGGGAPGGEGGRLVLVVKSLENDPNVLLDGGAGGKLGPPGSPPNYATPGSPGEDGGAGHLDILTLEQWRQTEQLTPRRP